jgi:hypothetical protein
MSKNFGRDRGATNDVTIRRIRVACWISKAICTYAHAHVHAFGCPDAHTHNYAHTGQYVMTIAFPQQQWFHERASVLRYTYIACLVTIYKSPLPVSYLEPQEAVPLYLSFDNSLAVVSVYVTSTGDLYITLQGPRRMPAFWAQSTQKVLLSQRCSTRGPQKIFWKKQFFNKIRSDIGKSVKKKQCRASH